MFAISDGSSISYDSSFTYYSGSGNPAVAKFWLNGDDSFVGTCHEFGAPNVGSGTATAGKLSNTSRIAKAMYYFGVERGWGDFVGTNNSYGYALKSISQYMSGTLDEYVNNPSAHSAQLVAQARGSYEAAERAFQNYPAWENVEVPDSFEVYACRANGAGDQDFILWTVEPEVTTGTIMLKKASSNTAITG